MLRARLSAAAAVGLGLVFESEFGPTPRFAYSYFAMLREKLHWSSTPRQ